MSSFADIHARAVARKGQAYIDERLPNVTPLPDVSETPDDRWLSSMAMCAFAAGFTWRVIQAKWDGFEEAFYGFDPVTVAGFDEGIIEGLTQDRRIVRNPQKIRATVENAAFVARVAEEHGGFGRFVQNWPDDDLIGLWAYLKKHGARLGGNTGPRVLRYMRKDTFILTNDVTHGLTELGLMTAKPTSGRGQREAQAAFLAWREETGRPLAELSVLLALSVDR